MRALGWLFCVALVGCVGCQQRVLLGYQDDTELGSGLGGAPVTEAASTSESEPREPLGLPEPGEVLWSAHLETGDVSEWTGDGDGYEFRVAEAQLMAGTQRAHAGSHALEAVLEAIGDVLPQAVMFRTVDLSEGFYSAWYLVDRNYDANFWVIMKFQGERPWQGQATNDRFDIDLSRSPDDGQLHLQLDEFDGSATLAPIAVPINQWFRVEIFYRSSPNDDGRLVVWQDDELVFDTGERPTAPSSRVGFGVGSVAWRVAPLPATIWIDDIEIRTAH